MESHTFIESSVAFLLFTLEWYHIWGHIVILFRLRMLPRKDLIRIRFYFLFDTATVFCSSILFTGKLRWLAVLQIIQHSYYFLFWNKTDLTKRIINWSSLDFVKSDMQKTWQFDNILGTGFDVAVHVCMAYLLGQYLSVLQVTLALGLVQLGVITVLFGPRFAWAHPNNIPPWIEKRINPETIKGK